MGIRAPRAAGVATALVLAVPAGCGTPLPVAAPAPVSVSFDVRGFVTGPPAQGGAPTVDGKWSCGSGSSRPLESPNTAAIRTTLACPSGTTLHVEVSAIDGDGFVVPAACEIRNADGSITLDHREGVYKASDPDADVARCSTPVTPG